MSPLRVESYRPGSQGDSWPGEIPPGGHFGSVSNLQPDGRTWDVYVFECELDDSKSVIYKAPTEVERDASGFPMMRISTDRTRWSVVRELRKGQVFEMTVENEFVMPGPRIIRFTHI